MGLPDVYYVYELADPRDGSVFYVGKGKGDRKSQHVRDARKGVKGHKCDRIRTILAAGMEVTERVTHEFDVEDEAYEYERDLIAHYGLSKLTNIAAGGREMTSELVEARRDARAAARSTSRAARVLSRFKEVGFRFGGRWFDIPREKIERMIASGVSHVFDVLGESEGIEEFRKHRIAIENKG